MSIPEVGRVPFRLRSGKAIGNPRKEAVINFRDPEQIPRGLVGAEGQNRLRIGLGFGSDTVRFDIAVNGPGDPKELDFATLEATLGAGYLSEYGEVLKTVLDGTPALSVRGDAAVDCWRIIDRSGRHGKRARCPPARVPGRLERTGAPAGERPSGISARRVLSQIEIRARFGRRLPGVGDPAPRFAARRAHRSGLPREPEVRGRARR